MMVMGAVEGLIAFSIRPALDVVLNPQSTVQKLALFQIPWSGSHDVSELVCAASDPLRLERIRGGARLAVSCQRARGILRRRSD